LNATTGRVCCNAPTVDLLCPDCKPRARATIEHRPRPRPRTIVPLPSIPAVTTAAARTVLAPPPPSVADAIQGARPTRADAVRAFLTSAARPTTAAIRTAVVPAVARKPQPAPLSLIDRIREERETHA
jgi:hypothetical protein